jgi:multiple sugar transport system permease protein
MKLGTFARFVAPSLLLMLALMAAPLVMTLALSLRHCAPEMETVTVRQSGPFGSQEVVTQRVRTDARGEPVRTCRFAGLAYYRKVLGIAATEADIAAGLGSGQAAAGGPDPGTAPTELRNEFADALRFTLVYTFATAPFILGLGFVLALAVNRLAPPWKAVVITASLLPFIITPVVGALAIKWLFRDDGLVPALLAPLGIHIHWMAQAWSAQLLIILYGIWHVVPFAFIVLYAGLQSVPQDSLEAARIDGASRWQQLRYVTVPHLMPLVVFVLLIHLMDAYRVFEPVLVLTQGAFTTSVQYLTYHILLEENNPYKASAASVLTLCGIVVLLIPLLRRTWQEQRGKAR